MIPDFLFKFLIGTLRSERHIGMTILRASLLGKSVSQGCRKMRGGSPKKIVTSVFTYVYAVCKWPVDCSLNIKTIPSGTLVMEVRR